MDNTNALAWYRALDNDVDYLTEEAKIDFAVHLDRRLQQEGLSKADLARRIDTSQAYITKVLRGDANLTLASMVKLAHATNSAVHVHIAPRQARVRWLEVLQGKPRHSSPEPAANLWATTVQRLHGQISAAA